MAGNLTGVRLDANRWGLVLLLFPGVAEGMGQGTAKPTAKQGHETGHGFSSRQNKPQSWKTGAT
jgi:hypothetical protein